jgi:signal peptidase II
MKTKRVLKNLLILLILISNISCDQISKNIVRQKIDYNTQINVINHYVILTKVENTGAFLGLGNSIHRQLYKIIMIIFPLIAIGYGLFYLIKRNNLSMLIVVGISFIISGGLGNICDRILYGSVTDFLYFDFVLFHTGIVNMADISVTIGFIMILYEYYVNHRKLTSKIIVKQ